MKYILMAFACMSLTACLSDDDKASILSNAEQAAATLNLGSAALETAGEALPGGTALNNGGFEAFGGDCDGQVTNMLTDAQEVGEYLGCILTTNSKNPETPLGSFHLVSEIMSFLDDSTDFTYASEYTTHENLTGMLDTSDGDQTATVSIRERALSSGWDYHIQICILSLVTGSGTITPNSSIADCESGGFTFELFLIDSDNKIGFKTIERFGSFGGGATFMLDSASQELRFEAWDDANGRHTRAYVSGTVSSTYSLENISAVEIATADQGVENSGDGTDAIYAKFDGTNLCINTFDDDDSDHASAGNGTANLTAQGTCSSFPVYDGGFFTNGGGLEAFLVDGSKGVPSFDASSFGIDSYFIDN